MDWNKDSQQSDEGEKKASPDIERAKEAFKKPELTPHEKKTNRWTDAAMMLMGLFVLYVLYNYFVKEIFSAMSYQQTIAEDRLRRNK